MSECIECGETFDQLRDAVVEEELRERIERLEREVEELREVVGDDSQGSEKSGRE